MSDTAPASTTLRTPEMDAWLISLDTGFRDILAKQPLAGTASPKSAAAAPMPDDDASGGGAAPGEGAKKKIGTEIDVLALQIVNHETKYGAIRVTATIKAATTTSGEGEVGKTYTANDAKHREAGVKKSFSLAEMETAHMFGFELAALKLELANEFSGGELAIGTELSFELHCAAFKQPAKSSAKVTLLKYSGEGGIELPNVELSITQPSSTIETGPVSTVLSAELKGAYVTDKEKVLKVVGKEMLKKIAKDALKKQAEKLGVKVLGREAAEAVLKDLGPVAAAFSVGLDIGELLNEYTVAPKVAAATDEAILGDLNEQYQRADTLGKMWLLSKNSPRIAAALVASGVAGAAAGIGDVVLFKLMHLDRLKDFGVAMEEFAKGVTAALRAIRDAIQQGVGGTIVYGALMIGIKANPKNHKVADPNLAPIMSGIYKAVKPLYRKQGGFNDLIGMHLYDCEFDEKAFEKFVSNAFAAGATYPGVETSDPQSMNNSLEEFLLSEFLGFLQHNKLITYSVKTDGNMDPDDIDQRLLDDLF